MARRVFFSFHYQRDIWRVNQIRSIPNVTGCSAAGFQDASIWEDAKKKGDDAIKKLIRDGLKNRFLSEIGVSFGRFPWLISQALSVTYMAGERRLYLERNCRLPESPAHSRRRNREGPASSKGLNSQRGFGPAVEPRRKSRPRSTSLHGSSPCKCQRLSTLRWDRLPPSRPSTKSGARAGGRRLSDRRLHRWLAGTSASAPSSHGAADLLGLNRAHICVRNQKTHPSRSSAWGKRPLAGNTSTTKSTSR